MKLSEEIIREVYLEEIDKETLDKIEFQFYYWKNYLEELDMTKYAFADKLIDKLKPVIKAGLDKMSAKLVNLSKDKNPEIHIELFERGKGLNLGFKNYVGFADQMIPKMLSLLAESNIRLNPVYIETAYGDNMYATAFFEKLYSDPLAEEHNMKETELGQEVQEIIWRYIDGYFE